MPTVILMSLLSGCAPMNYFHEQNTEKVPNIQKTQEAQQEVQQEAQQEEDTIKLIAKGTTVDDLDLSDCPVTEAPGKMEEWAEDKLEESRLLLYNGTEVPIKLKELGVTLDTEKTLAEIQSNPGTTLDSTLKVEPLTAGQVLEEKLKKYHRPPKDASYKIMNDKVVVNPATHGKAPAVDEFLEELRKVPLSQVPSKMKLSTTDLPPSVTTEAVKSLAFDSVIGEFTTRFAVSERNRSANLIAAAKALDRKLIRPGETFSFNKTVGPREPGTGYKDAYVIVNGEYVQGVGGGVCQVSSTLYNTVLLADLGVVERVPHAVAVGYVPPGQDATVNYPNIDFKFQNTTSGLIYLRTEVKPGMLTVKLWGKKTGKSVRIERQILKEINYKTEKRYDSSLRYGQIIQDQKGTKGIVVKTWKAVRNSKGIVTKQFLGQDSYAPANRILRIGG